MESEAKPSGAAGGETEEDRPTRGLYGQRPSKCHDDVVRMEFARIDAMSARERMIEALSLAAKIAPFLPETPGKDPEGDSKP
jgi:hypothetical protein